MTKPTKPPKMKPKKGLAVVGKNLSIHPTRKNAKLWCAPSIGERIARVLITEVPR